MNRFVQWFSHGLIKYRYGFLGICLVASVFFAYQLQYLSVKTNLGDFYPLKHPYLKIQNRLNEIFGGLNQVSIAIEVKDGTILNPDTLDRVWQITNQLYLTDGINPGRVVSLSARKVKHIEADAQGFVTDWLMHDPPKTQEGLDALKSRIVRNPLVYGAIVSKDFKATLIQADFESGVSARRIFGMLKTIEKKFQDSRHTIHISGQPVLEGWLDFYLPRMAWLFVAALAVISVILYIGFRSKRGVFLPVLSAGMATLWGLGFTALVGFKFTPATVLAPFLVFALGVSHSVQFVKRYYEQMTKRKRDSKAAAIKITRALFVPAFLGLLTDGVAPFTLLAVPLGMVRSLAVAIGFGILSIFFSTVVLIPNLLSFMKPPKRLEVIREERITLTSKILQHFARLAVKKGSRRAVIAVFFAVTAVSIFGMTKLEVGDKQPGTSLLYRSSEYNRSEKFISEKFSTADPYYIFVAGKQQDAFLSSAALKEMDGLQRYLEQEVSGVGRSLSLAEYIKGMNMTMFGGDRKAFLIPDNDKTIAEYLFLYSLTGFPGDFDPVVNQNYQYANIKVDLKDHKASTINAAIRKTDEWLRLHHRDDGIDFYYAGGSVGMLAAVNQIVTPMLVTNFLQTSFFVFVCLILAYGSLVSAWLLMIPLAFRTFVLFGILGFLQISLTQEMIPVVALGIGCGVDFSLYIVSRLNDELKERRASLDDCLLKAVHSSGKAVFFTGLTLTIGVATWIFSPILMQARLGMFLAFFIFFNAIGTLVVLPSMIMTVKPKFLKR
ncbi:MAG TPA: MMPL family transporter [Patescibacteria group bacterium]|nr:MMPL family transporter [Patescibacteria group bacterium]